MIPSLSLDNSSIDYTQKNLSFETVQPIIDGKTQLIWHATRTECMRNEILQELEVGVYLLGL